MFESEIDAVLYCFKNVQGKKSNLKKICKRANIIFRNLSRRFSLFIINFSFSWVCLDINQLACCAGSLYSSFMNTPKILKLMNMQYTRYNITTKLFSSPFSRLRIFKRIRMEPCLSGILAHNICKAAQWYLSAEAMQAFSIQYRFGIAHIILAKYYFVHIFELVHAFAIMEYVQITVWLYHISLMSMWLYLYSMLRRRERYVIVFIGFGDDTFGY